MNVTSADRRRLEAIVADGCTAQKHVWRAKIILATADGCGTSEIMRRSGKSTRPASWPRASRDRRATRRESPASRRCPRRPCSVGRGQLLNFSIGESAMATIAERDVTFHPSIDSKYQLGRHMHQINVARRHHNSPVQRADLGQCREALDSASELNQPRTSAFRQRAP